MIHYVVTAQLGAALQKEPGWTRPEPQRFSHEETGVHIYVYASDVVLVLRDGADGPMNKALGTKTTYRPDQAVRAMLEVARAVVAARSSKAASAAAPPGD